MAQIRTTPGVYVEGVSLKALSIAQVETAIPAFIGYTARANSSSLFVTVKISTMTEYERSIGVGAATTNFVLHTSLI